MNPEKCQPVEKDKQHCLCVSRTKALAAGSGANEKLRPTEDPGSAEKQLWGQKGKMEHTEDKLLGQERRW